MASSTPSINKKFARAIGAATRDIAKRGIYVVAKGTDGYKIVNIVSNITEVDSLPAKEFSHILCDKYNRGLKVNMKFIHPLIHEYTKHYIDSLHYANTLKNIGTRDQTTCEIRLAHSTDSMALIINRLLSL